MFLLSWLCPESVCVFKKNWNCWGKKTNQIKPRKKTLMKNTFKFHYNLANIFLLKHLFFAIFLYLKQNYLWLKYLFFVTSLIEGDKYKIQRLSLYILKERNKTALAKPFTCSFLPISCKDLDSDQLRCKCLHDGCLKVGKGSSHLSGKA